MVQLCFLLVLVLGVFARCWDFDKLPPGLNADEASTGVDAFSLYHYGVDRNNTAYPVQFASWGSGQNALYAYAIIPAIALGGLSPFTVRVPMLVAGLLTLILVYFVARRFWSASVALLTMFLVAIMPWHVMLSRWGLESNLLPAVFLLAFYSMLKSRTDNYWYVGGCAALGLALYAYGPAYVAVPVFLVWATLQLWRDRWVAPGSLVAGAVIFVVLALPIGLFLAVNSFHLNTIHLGPITIARLPAEARYETALPLLSSNPLRELYWNARTAIELMLRQADGLAWNAIAPYGVFYRITTPLMLVGVLGLIRVPDASRRPEYRLLLGWIAACLGILLLQRVNVNRANLCLVPMVLCTVIPLEWMTRRWRYSMPVIVVCFLAAFILFFRAYTGEKNREVLAGGYHDGLLPALQFTRNATPGPICVSTRINMPYIFVLFVEQWNPRNYESSIEYVEAHSSFRQVRRLDRYTFGLENCPADPDMTYVLGPERPPVSTAGPYMVRRFGNYVVYSRPK